MHFFNDSIENIAKNNIENVETHLKPIEFLKRPPFCFLRNTDVIPRNFVDVESFINAWPGAATLNSYVRKQNVECGYLNKNHVQTPGTFHDLNMDFVV